MLAKTRRPDVTGVIVTGAQDTEYGPDVQRVVAATRAAGMDIAVQQVPGAHTWSIASDALTHNLPWISGRLGLLDLTHAPTAPPTP